MRYFSLHIFATVHLTSSLFRIITSIPFSFWFFVYYSCVFSPTSVHLYVFFTFHNFTLDISYFRYRIIMHLKCIFINSIAAKIVITTDINEENIHICIYILSYLHLISPHLEMSFFNDIITECGNGINIRFHVIYCVSVSVGRWF